jgi:CBS domain-containing protein
VARRGYHLSREYAVDPLEILFVREVMRPNIVALPAEVTAEELAHSLHPDQSHRRQRLYPVVDEARRLVGVVTRSELENLLKDGNQRRFGDLIRSDPKVAYPDEPLRAVVYRMAKTGLTRFPVIEPNGSGRLLAMISLEDLLAARSRNLEAELQRERVIPFRMVFPQRGRRRRAA